MITSRDCPRLLPPGEKFFYKGADTQALGWMVRRVTGESLADYLSEKIWQPMGMEHDAFWNTDAPGPDGMEAAFTCLNATLRDFGRFGLMFLNHGKWNGKQIVPADWVDHATVPESPQVQPGQLVKRIGARLRISMVDVSRRRRVFRGGNILPVHLRESEREPRHRENQRLRSSLGSGFRGPDIRRILGDSRGPARRNPAPTTD